MKKIFKYFPVWVVCVIALGAAFVYFRPAQEIEIAAALAPAATKDINYDLDGRVLAHHDNNGEVQVARHGFALEFEGIKARARIGRVRINFMRDGDRYETSMSVRAAGIFKSVLDEKLSLKSAGRISDGRMEADYFLNSSVKDNGKGEEKVHDFTDGPAYSYNGTKEEVDGKIYEQAVDPLVILILVGNAIGDAGNCNFSSNSLLDKLGFTVESSDKGDRKDSGIKSKGKPIVERRCDITVRNRAGKKQKAFPFDHEFAKKGKKARAAKIRVYYSDIDGGGIVPVYIKIIETPIGDFDIRLVKISRF
ncbi:MAG: DUF3108 domain-containing protein [Rickettsiales bacterium]|jgi:hypothetical protein|nr:DUF3108 domain-containing protein [Rickettsiales bacterium]